MSAFFKSQKLMIVMCSKIFLKIPHRIVLSWLDHKIFLKLRVNFFHYHYSILYFLYIRLYVFCLSEVSSDYFFIEDNATIKGS